MIVIVIWYLFCQIIGAANEVVESIDRDELARLLSMKGDPEEEEFEVGT